ncbi:unnamed protein product, partial [Discosporangium mesarthrocarpum]
MVSAALVAKALVLLTARGGSREPGGVSGGGGHGDGGGSDVRGESGLWGRNGNSNGIMRLPGKQRPGSPAVAPGAGSAAGQSPLLHQQPPGGLSKSLPGVGGESGPGPGPWPWPWPWVWIRLAKPGQA